MTLYILAGISLLIAAKILITNQVKHRANNRFDAVAFYKATNVDTCPRCFRNGVVVVRATSTGALYGACRWCDQEVLL